MRAAPGGLSGLCGWLGPRPEDAPGEIAIRRMIAGLALAPPGVVCAEVRERGAVALAAPPGWGDACADERYAAAILGTPRWTRTEWAEEATRSGTAHALIAAYRVAGPDVLAALRGGFAAVLLDTLECRAFLAVDRFGIETLCWAEAGGALVFGSTTDAVVAHPAVTPALSPQALYDYLYFYRVPSPATVFAGIAKLSPAHCLDWRLQGGGVPRLYWLPPYGAHDSRPAEDLAAELRDRLTTAVGRAVAGQDPGRIGAFLSGGLDSSTLVGLLAETLPAGPKAFTIGFDVPGYDEMAYAEAAVRHFDAEPHAHYMTADDVVETLPAIAAAYDEPFGNSSAIPAYRCATMARAAGVDLMVAGDGGDEVFAGNERYVSQDVFERYRRLPQWLRRALIEPLVATLPGSLRPIRQARSYVRRANIPLPDRLESYNHMNDLAIDGLFEPEIAAAIDPEAPLAWMRAIYGRPEGADTVQRMMYLDLHLTLADCDLRKVGRTCGLAGVAVRYPFLDDDLVAFAAAIPVARLLEGGRLRAFYKRALADFLPRKILTKPKHGFALPFQGWLASHPPLAELVEASLSALKGRGLIEGSLLDRLIAGHRTGRPSPLDGMLWDFLALELWARDHLDRRPGHDLETQRIVPLRRGQAR